MKKIITFLGTGNYQKTTYEGVNENKKKMAVETRFVQEAIHEIIDKDATLYVGLTDKAREENWISRKKNTKHMKLRKVFQEGLKEILDNKGISYKEFSLKDGKNEKEMWQNFESIFKYLMKEMKYI